jgi:hypothetical protein
VEVADVVVEERREDENGASRPEGNVGAPLDPSSKPQDERKGAPLGAREGVPDDASSNPQHERGPRRKSRKGIGGPKTAAGKAVVRLNAMKHGVLAETPVLPLVESAERWEELRRDVLDWFDLKGPFQESMGTRAATLIWRLERAGRAETEATRSYQSDVPEDWKSSMRMQGLPIPDRKTRERVEEEYRMLMARLLPGDEMMDKILRYESKLHRYLLQTIYMILVVKGLKQARSGRFYGIAELNPPEVSKNMGTPPGGGYP